MVGPRGRLTQAGFPRSGRQGQREGRRRLPAGNRAGGGKGVTATVAPRYLNPKMSPLVIEVTERKPAGATSET
jgi:hypothetical protein